MNTTDRIQRWLPTHQADLVMTFGETANNILSDIGVMLDKVPLKRQKVDRNWKLMVYAHYFYSGCDWFIIDYSKQYDEFYGYVILNGDTQMSELGYIPAGFLRENGKIELDFHWTPVTLGAAKHSRYPNEFPNM